MWSVNGFMDSFNSLKMSQTVSLEGTSITNIVVISALSTLVVYWTYCAIYNVYLHPLRTVPGPRLYATGRIPYIFDVLTGRLAVSLHDLHEKYGPVVRTASNEVSFIDPAAWDVIYSRKNTTNCEFPKNYDSWDETENDFTKTIFLASKHDHPRMRKALSPVFSSRMLRNIEPFLQKHVDNFLRGIKDASQSQSGQDQTAFQNPVDLNDWFSWLTFDLAAELVLGESFHSLESPEHRDWLEQLGRTWPFISVVSAFKNLGKTKDAFSALLPRDLLQGYVDQLKLVRRTAGKMLNMVPVHPTLMSIAKPISDLGKPLPSLLSDKEVLANAELVVTAGTDTSATALSAIIYLLCTNPEVKEKLIAEIRAFPTEQALIRGSTNSTPYLAACITETLRLHAVVPEGLPRLCPGAGQEISGYWIPGGTRCQVSPHAANVSSTNFTDAKSFIPERWLTDDARFANDNKTAFRPFSTGPRNCIGQNFALTTIKMTLCRLFYRFDLECATDDNWLDQRSYLLWRRRPLMIKLAPVERSEELLRSVAAV